MKKTLLHTLIATLCIILMSSSIGFAQDNGLKNYRMLFKFNTIKQADNSRVLEVSFIARNKKDRKDKVPVYDADILFYNVGSDEDIALGTAKTDKEGTAILTLSESQTYVTDADGYIHFKAVFEGTDSMDSEEDELAVKDLFMEMELTEIDSVKTVILKAFSLDSLQTKVPVEEADIVFSVGGMLSRMPIEEGTLEDGEYEFEFPEGIPGNKDGMMDVFAFIEDHDDFGNVIQKKNVNWGYVHSITNAENNKLWTDYAPLWMYLVLSILLIGVWANYAYSIYNLFKIKKEGKDLEMQADEK